MVHAPHPDRPPAPNNELLKVREQVWRARFQGDAKTLEKLVAPGTFVISDGEDKWKNQNDVIHASVEFHNKGGRLIRLEFPHTDVQRFGDVAIVWSSFLLETEMDGKRSSSVGRRRRSLSSATVNGPIQAGTPVP